MLESVRVRQSRREFVSIRANEYEDGLLGLWMFLLLWGFCTAPNTMVSFWGRNGVLLHGSWFPVWRDSRAGLRVWMAENPN